MNHALTIQAALTGGAYEKTQNVYGVTTGGGSGLNSNDILAAVKYPDKTTCNPSASEQESYQVNTPGQQISLTDPNGNVHPYPLDLLGPAPPDARTTSGSSAQD